MRYRNCRALPVGEEGDGRWKEVAQEWEDGIGWKDVSPGFIDLGSGCYRHLYRGDVIVVDIGKPPPMVIGVYSAEEFAKLFQATGSVIDGDVIYVSQE